MLVTAPAKFPIMVVKPASIPSEPPKLQWVGTVFKGFRSR